ncbi:MAG: fatty acid desaturase family protein [Pseudomonadota bacterium]
MAAGKDFLTAEEIRPLARRSDLMGALLLVHCWGVMAGALALFAAWPSVVTFLLAVVLIGSRQLGLAILMHEAAHNALFASRRLNNLAGQYLCARPILAELTSYRTYHLTHHRFTQTEKDPDLRLSRPFPTTRASLKRKFWRDLTGQTGVKTLAAQIRLSFQLAFDAEAMEAGREDMAQAFKSASLRPAFAAQLVIFALLWAVGAWWWYFAFWLLPLLTWFQLVLRIRNIAEHGATEASDDPLQNVRTTKAGPLLGLILAPYWVNYHLEHHLVMHVPCWQLPRLHALMLAKGHGPRMRVARSYWQVLGEVGWHRVAT